MIRARESLDQWAVRAHDLLDQVQRRELVPVSHIEWALAYLGDRAGTTNPPRELTHGYDATDAARDATVH